MKKVIAVLIVVGVFFMNIPIKAATPEYVDFFEKDKIIDIHIQISEENLNDIYTYAKNEEYHSATVTIGSTKLQNVGIRTKGNSTLNAVAKSDSDRYSFRLKFDKYEKGQSFFGLDELCLNNCYSDASYMREYLHYEILEQIGVSVPERAYCNLYINGKAKGFYLAIEGLDESFLEKEFGENYEAGNLYKMEMGATLSYNEKENYSYAEHKVGNDDNLTLFKEFIYKLNHDEDFESFLNVDSALKYIASNTVLCNYDSYNGNMHHNFYMYADENNVFTVIPWDFNMSFGGFKGNNKAIGIDTPIASGSMESVPLIKRLLEVEEYKEKYYGYIQEILCILEGFDERIEELKNIIQPYVENDPTAFYTIEEFEKATTLSEGKASDDNNQKGFGNGGESILQCVKDRTESVIAQLNGTSEKSTVTDVKSELDRNSQKETPFNENGRKQNADMGNNRQGKGMVPFEGMKMPQRENTNNNKNPKNNTADRFQGGKDQGGYSNNTIRVHVNGNIVVFDVEPKLKNDTTFVEIAPLAEALNLTYTVNNETKDIAFVKDDVTVNSKAELFDEDVLMVPIREISEAFGMKVKWENNAKLVEITKK